MMAKRLYDSVNVSKTIGEISLGMRDDMLKKTNLLPVLELAVKDAYAWLEKAIS